MTIRLLSGHLPEQVRSPLAQLLPDGLGDALKQPCEVEAPVGIETAGSWIAEETPDRVAIAESDSQAAES